MDAVPGTGGVAAAGLVLVALFGAAWLLRRGTLTVPGRKRSLEFAVETAFSLGERRSLAVVTVEGRRLLLGLTPTNISLIGELPGAGAPFDAALAQRLPKDDRS